MRILEQLKSWLDEVEWCDVTPNVDEEKQSSSAKFGYMVNDEFACDGYFEISEPQDLFRIYIYPELTLPPKHMDAVHELINAMNVQIPIGTFHVIADKRRLRFYAGIDVEDAEFTPAMIHNLMGAAGRQLGDKMPRVAALCFGGKSVAEALEMEVDN